ncbi:hypothetical protein L9F63_013671, partial [Diploptera punctata]
SELQRSLLVRISLCQPLILELVSLLSFDKMRHRQSTILSNTFSIRTSGGRLHLVPDIGKIPLADALLIEDPSEHGVNDDDESSVCSMSSQSSGISETSSGSGHLHNRDFKIILDVKAGSPQVVVHLVAPTIQEKAAWISDISQYMDNFLNEKTMFCYSLQPKIANNDILIIFYSAWTMFISMTYCTVQCPTHRRSPMPQSIRNDPKLFKDDVDIRFSRTLNSCKVPQIRYATPERLLERLTDLRFLSIDFLNTFLLTYRVFTDGVTVLEALKKVFYNADPPEAQTSVAGSIMSLDVLGVREDHSTLHLYEGERRRSSVSPRRTSGASSVSGYGSEVSDRDRSHSYDSQAFSKGHWRCSYRKFEEEQRELALIKEGPPIIRQSPTHQPTPTSTPRKSVSIRVEAEDDGCHLTIPKTITVSSSSETLTDATVLSAPSSPSNLSTATLVGSNNSNSENSPQETESPQTQNVPETETKTENKQSETAIAESKEKKMTSTEMAEIRRKGSEGQAKREYDDDKGRHEEQLPDEHGHGARSASITTSVLQNYYASRRSIQESECGGSSMSQRASFQHDSPQNSSKAGVVITSFRQSQRRLFLNPPVSVGYVAY